MSGWIECSKQMPPSGRLVLIAYSGGFRDVGEWCDYTNDPLATMSAQDGNAELDYRVLWGWSQDKISKAQAVLQLNKDHMTPAAFAAIRDALKGR